MAIDKITAIHDELAVDGLATEMCPRHQEDVY